MRANISVLFSLLVLSAGCLSSAQDVFTDEALIAWIESASQTADQYEELTSQAIEAHEGYWNEELPKEEANVTLIKAIGALWKLQQEWNSTPLYEDSHAFRGIHLNLRYAGLYYTLGVASLSVGVVNDDYSQAIDGMETINETHDELQEARDELRRIDPRWF